ncbi:MULTISPECIES: hypothetical protein [unclassified Nocardia]
MPTSSTWPQSPLPRPAASIDSAARPGSPERIAALSNRAGPDR